MACREYEDELRELAAGALAPRKEADVRAHLAGCAACRGTFEAEKRLFATVDAELRQEMNAEVPASLAARIRLAAEAEADRRHVKWWRWAVVAGPAVATAVVFMLLVRGRETPRTPESPAQVPIAVRRENPAESVRPKQELHERAVQAAGVPVPKGAGNAQERKEPEVLVPAGEEAALAQFAEGLRVRRSDAEALFEAMRKKPAERLAISPIEMANLEVRPLEEPTSER